MVLEGKSSQEYSVNTGVPQGSILVPALFCYTLMTFLVMLPVMLQPVLMILLFILIVNRHPICGNNLNWLLNLNLIYKTLWTGVRSALLISLLGNFSWFHLTGLITTGLARKKKASAWSTFASFYPRRVINKYR